MVFRWGQSLGINLGFSESIQNRYLAKILASFMHISCQFQSTNHLGTFLVIKITYNLLKFIICTSTYWCFNPCVSVTVFWVACIRTGFSNQRELHGAIFLGEKIPVRTAEVNVYVNAKQGSTFCKR